MSPVDRAPEGRAAHCSPPFWATAGVKWAAPPPDAEDPQFYFDAYAADRCIRWIETYCVHTTGHWAGKAFILARWQRRIIRKIFGWKRADGTRKYKIAFIAVPRKNGKTTLCAAIALFLQLADGEQTANIFSIAGNEEQARIVFNEAKAMIALSPQLRAIEALETNEKSIYYFETRSAFRPLPGKRGKHHGLNPHGVIGDEVHEWDSRSQYDAMTSARAARRNPLQLYITTAGHDKKSLCWELWKKALAVQKGESDETHVFADIFAADENDDWTDEAVWKKANPNYGVSVSPEFMREELRTAKDSPAEEIKFRQLYLNQWTESAARLIPGPAWRACGEAFPAEKLAGAKCYCGIDIGTVDDFSALAAMFPAPNPVSEIHAALLFWYWSPEKSIRKRIDQGDESVRRWLDKGHLIKTPGDATDFGILERDMVAFLSPFTPIAVGFDPWQCRDLSQRLTDENVNMIEVRPTVANLGVPTCEFVRDVVKGDILHNQNPVTDWMADNAVARHNATGVFVIDKMKSADKVDGISAAITAKALSIDLVDDAPQHQSFVL